MGIGVEMGTVCLIDFVSDLFVLFFLGNIRYKYIYSQFLSVFCLESAQHNKKKDPKIRPTSPPFNKT